MPAADGLPPMAFDEGESSWLVGSHESADAAQDGLASFGAPPESFLAELAVRANRRATHASSGSSQSAQQKVVEGPPTPTTEPLDRRASTGAILVSRPPRMGRRGQSNAVSAQVAAVGTRQPRD